MPCGGFTVYAIEDGWFFREPGAFLPDSDPAFWRTHPEFLVEGRVRVSMGCFVVTDGTRTVVVDSGIGSLVNALPGDAQGGRLPQALALIGIRPEDVETVLHTHLHLDHIGGDRTVGGDPFFPNARIAVHRRELDHWMETDQAPGAAIRGVVEGFVGAGRIDPFEGDHEVAPGITAVETPGHTPGHVSFAVTSQGTRTFVTGDVAHHPVQTGHPDWGVAADLDPELARTTRDRVFTELAGTGTLVAAGHFPRPGLGYVEVDDAVRVFVSAAAVQVG